jgi:HJR/Mrr/RecB family endonuclease
MIAAFISYGMAFGIPPENNMAKEVFIVSVGLCGLLTTVFLSIDLVFFKEIRLYKNRIVKIWHILGSREILLLEAMLKGNNYLERLRAIYNIKRSILLRFLTGIFYIEGMATKEDAKMMTRLMPQVTGRDEQEFEQIRLNMKPLLKNVTR